MWCLPHALDIAFALTHAIAITHAITHAITITIALPHALTLTHALTLALTLTLALALTLVLVLKRTYMCAHHSYLDCAFIESSCVEAGRLIPLQKLCSRDVRFW
jgi:hypothetical protein